jgi:hypothetical protein
MISFFRTTKPRIAATQPTRYTTAKVQLVSTVTARWQALTQHVNALVTYMTCAYENDR